LSLRSIIGQQKGYIVSDGHREETLLRWEQIFVEGRKRGPPSPQRNWQRQSRRGLTEWKRNHPPQLERGSSRRKDFHLCENCEGQGRIVTSLRQRKGSPAEKARCLTKSAFYSGMKKRKGKEPGKPNRTTLSRRVIKLRGGESEL